MSKFKSNTIIIGYVNTYCLVCDTYFQTIDEALGHMETIEHSHQLETHPYMEKYGKNFIRKVSKGYYCELCYLLLASAVKVSVHIGQPAHLSNKGSQLKRVGNVIIVQDDALIADKAWHSICDDTCAVCSVEFDNEDLHRNEQTHQLKLIQSKVHCDGHDGFYRKTDEMFCHCLTCNVVFEYKMLKEHFDDLEHKNAYAKCQEELKKYRERNTTNSEKKVTTVDKSKITDKNRTSAVNKSNATENKPTTSKVDEEYETESWTVNIKSESNIKDVKDSESKTHMTIVSKSKKEDLEINEVMEFCQKHNFTYKGGHAYCRCCETKVRANIRRMKEHICAKEHINKSRCVGTREEEIAFKKQPLTEYVTNVETFENLLGDDNVIINERICIPVTHMLLVERVGSGLMFCWACDVTMREKEANDHLLSARHDFWMSKIPIITNLGTQEFIREIRNELFHCGHCNHLLNGNSLLSHLRSESHLDELVKNAERMKLHAPQLAERRRQQEDHMIAAILSLRNKF